MITISNILKAKVFEESQVIAGKEGISREVSTITIAEVPDAANWLRGGELVCTTAFFVSSQVTHQKEWIQEIISNGASALVIKASRFLGVVPAAILEVANREDFPIISLAHEVTWPSVIEEFMDFFMNEKIRLMKRVEEVQNELTNLVLDNASVEDIVMKIAQLIDNPVILEDASLQTIAIGLPKTPLTLADQKVLEVRSSNSFHEEIVNTDFFKETRKGAFGEWLETSLFEHEESKIMNTMTPVFSNKSFYGFISMINFNKVNPLVDRIVLKSSTTALALSLMQQYVNEQTYRKRNLALIEDIISGRIHSKISYGEDFNDINWSDPMTAIKLEVLELNTDSTSIDNRSEELITRLIRKKFQKNFENVIVGNVGGVFTVLISYSFEKTHEISLSLKETLQLLKEELEIEYGKERIFIGVGGVYPNIKLVNRSYNEAENALAVAKKFQWKGRLLFSDEIGIYRIFSMIDNRTEIEEFCRSFLDELKSYDMKNGNVLLETFHVYLLCDGSVKATAKSLFLHPNTVAYRIKKVKSIINNDLSSPEFKLAYLFALESEILLNN